MGTQVQVDTITNVVNSSGLSTMNANDALLANEFDEVLYRDGRLAVTGDIDMDSNRLLNLPNAVFPTEPILLRQVATLTKGDPGGNVMSIGLVSGLSGMTIDDGVDLIQSSGFNTTGLGAARYVRLPAEPSADEQTAGLGYWIFHSNGTTVWWKLAEPVVTDYMFGAVGDCSLEYNGGVTNVTGTNDTPAVQKAVDHVLYWSGGVKRLYFPHDSLRRMDSTVHLGYGHDLNSFIIEGDMQNAAEQTTVLGGFFFTQNDSPGFNIQGGRRVVLRNMCIVGLNYQWLYSNFNAMTNMEPKTNWRGTQVRPVATDTSKSPCAGISIDAYANTSPAVPYPTVTYPSWTGIGSTQYGKGYTSQVIFEGVTVRGFEVGFIVQPNSMPIASNGDFIRWINCDSSYNETAFAVSHADARVLTFRDTVSHFCHTVLDSVTYGGGVGNVAAHFDCCSFDNAFRMFNVNLGITTQNFAPSIIVTNGYSEALYSMGTVRTSTATGKPGSVIFIGGEYNFATGKTGMYSPIYHLNGLGEVKLRIIGTSFTGTYEMMAFNCHVEELACVVPAVAYSAFETSTSAGRRAAGTTCGFWAPKIENAAILPRFYNDYGAMNITNFVHRSHGWDFTCNGGIQSGTSGGRGAPIPFFVKSIASRGLPQFIGTTPKQTLDRATYNLSAVSTTANETQFTVSLDFMGTSGRDHPDYCVGLGDIVQDSADGRLGYVKAYSKTGTGAGQTMTVTVRWITGVYTSNGTTWTSNVSISSTTGTLTFYCSRRGVFGLTQRLAMNATSGSGAVTFVEPGSETLPTNDLGANFVWPANVNDYLLGGPDAEDLDHSVFPAYTKITAITSAGGVPSGAMTFSNNARRTGITTAPLFIRV